MEDLGILLKILLCFSLLLGAIECFAGYKILKPTMLMWGLLIGVSGGIAAGILTENIIVGIVLALLLGVVFGLLFYELEAIGRFLLTAVLVTLALYLIIENIWIALMIGIPLGIAAIFFAKHVFIFSSSFSGAAILLFSAFAIINNVTSFEAFGKGIIAENIFAPFMLLWAALAVFGILCQYFTTQNEVEYSGNSSWYPVSSSENTSLSFSEMRYPGMQRAYRNYCINCGYDLYGSRGACPRCGFYL